MRRIGLILVLVLLGGCSSTEAATGKFVEVRGTAAPLPSGSSASLTLVSGVTTITLVAADLDDDLFRASASVGGGVVPRATVRGSAVALRLDPSDERSDGSPAALVVRISTKRTWTLKIAAGANAETLDLRAARVARVEVAGGTSRLRIVLPRPDSAANVRLSGGSGTVRLSAPTGTPTRLMLRSGGGSVVVDGASTAGVAAGSVWTTAGWAAASRRYDIDVVAGVGSLTLNRV